MQLVAYGAQDIYLTGNPQITFFKVVYRRHTNFAVESIEQTINGSVGSGSKVSVTVARNGDLLSRMYIQLTGNNASNDHKGFDAIDYVEVEVGGQVIDKHYGCWMKIWCDLTHDGDKKAMLNTMLCGGSTCGCGGATGGAGTLQTIPLQFWFCRNPGLALPLIALQYHEVKLNIKFCTIGSTASAEVWCDYIFLDTDERRRFAQVSHEYLIEQVQYNNGAAIDSAINLRFNHPVKEIVWQAVANGTGCCGAKVGQAECCDVVLQLNGHDRFRKRSGDYFCDTQRYEHHTGAPSSAALNTVAMGAVTIANPPTQANVNAVIAALTSAKTNPCVDAGTVYCYSFALKPEEHQPSGTCNFSRIDNAVMQVTQTTSATLADKIDVYAVNYNVLRIMSGMGGLAYSN